MLNYKIYDKGKLVLETHSKREVCRYIKVDISKIDDIIRKSKKVKSRYIVTADMVNKSSLDKDISEMIDLGYKTSYGRYKAEERSLFIKDLFLSKRKR